MEMPPFSLDAYRELLMALGRRKYASVHVSELAKVAAGRKVLLRHDVDLFPSACAAMARCEHELGARATYCFLLSGPYNMLAPENRALVRSLADMGHEIGLHYDLQVYPDHHDAARMELEAEIGILERIAGMPVRTISPHRVFEGRNDWFRESDEWINPYDSRRQAGLLYVSDSCRAWRDESLLQCFSEAAPDRLLLLTHPELWLDGGIRDRFSYLERVIIPRASKPMLEYFDKTVRDIWRKHPAAMAHDRREALARVQDKGKQASSA